MVKLTKHAKRAGCAAKHPPGYLLPLLENLPRVTDPNVIVGSVTADDAAVVRLDDQRALVFTTDFFTPIVDDPYTFGAIAAANALSDIYAMGAQPLSALNIVGFPDAELDPAVLVEILRGGAEKAKEAGIDIVGGHTIKTDEPIYGLAVIGTVHPARVRTNAGARPGDVLVLTKPIGVGIITTAAKQDQDTNGAIEPAIRLMSTLNRSAAEAMQDFDVHAATDVTGFGLLGHLRNVTAASGCRAVVELGRVPVMEHAWEYVKCGIAPGGTHANRRFLASYVDYAPEIDEATQLLLCDAQTSGGLLVAIDERDAQRFVAALTERGTPAQAIIGRIESGRGARIRVEG